MESARDIVANKVIIGDNEPNSALDSNDPSVTRDDPGSTKGKDEVLSHCEAMSLVKKSIRELLSDPLLSGLAEDMTLEELEDILHLEQGKAITLYLRRYDNSILPIIVLQGATVGDLKKAIERHVIRKHNREGGTSFISWRYIWKSYWLVYDKHKLTVDGEKLISYGITNRDEISFVKRLRKEWKEKRPRTKQFTAFN